MDTTRHTIRALTKNIFAIPVEDEGYLNIYVNTKWGDLIFTLWLRDLFQFSSGLYQICREAIYHDPWERWRPEGHCLLKVCRADPNDVLDGEEPDDEYLWLTIELEGEEVDVTIKHGFSLSEMQEFAASISQFCREFRALEVGA